MKRLIFLQTVIVLAILVGPALSPGLKANAAVQIGSGYWHTSGNQILDSNNNPVKGAGLNWSGFETTDFVASGLAAQPYQVIIDQIAQYGYNTIRIPFSNQMVETNPVPSPGALAANPDLQGLRSLDILDRLVTYAGQVGLKVILDNHRSSAGTSAQDNGLWYTASYPESAWIADWQGLASRYQNNATVIGFDLRNEPHTPSDTAAQGPGSDWGSGNMATDWRLAAQRAGNAVLAVNPNLLILVEGISRFPNSAGDFDYTWWGANLQGVKDFPVQLNIPGRLVYSPRDYGPDLLVQSWFNSSTTYESLVGVWTKYWAYIGDFPAGDPRLAPLWLGEFGTTNQPQDFSDLGPGSQAQWFFSLLRFIATRGDIHWTYWAANGDDRYGLLASDYGDVALPLKQQYLSMIQGVHYLPVVLNNASGGLTTRISIGNRSGWATPVSIAFYNQSGEQVNSQSFTISPNGSTGLFQGDGSLPGGFAGSAIVQSPSSLFLNVTVVGPNGGLMSYQSWSSPSRWMNLPVSPSGTYGGLSNALTLQNPNSSAASGSVQYFDGAGSVVATANFSIPSHGSQGFYQGDGTMPGGFIGRVVVNSSIPLAATTSGWDPLGAISY